MGYLKRERTAEIGKVDVRESREEGTSVRWFKTEISSVALRSNVVFTPSDPSTDGS